MINGIVNMVRLSSGQNCVLQHIEGCGYQVTSCTFPFSAGTLWFSTQSKP